MPKYPGESRSQEDEGDWEDHEPLEGLSFDEAGHDDAAGFRDRPLRALNQWDMELQLRMARMYPGKPLRQLSVMLKERPCIVAGTGRWRPISAERVTKVFRHFSRGFLLLFSKPSEETLSFFRMREDIALPALSDMVDIGPEHVAAYVYWLSCRYNAGRISVNGTEVELTCLRRLLTLLGKRDLLPGGVMLREYLKAKEILLPVPSWFWPAHAGGWEARGVAYRTLLRRIPRRSRQILRVLWLKIIFGLRLRECVRQRLAQWLTPAGLRLPAKKGGGKGGLPRFVPLPTWHPDWRHWRRVLNSLVAVASAQPSGLLMPDDKSLKNARSELIATLAAAGAYKRGMGISSHGTRYDFAVAAFLFLTGMPAPALRQLPYTAYTDSRGNLLPRVRKALLRISLWLGHRRAGIAETYVGSVTQLKREWRKALVLAGRLAPLANILAAGDCHGYVGAFLLDRLGNYDYHLVLRFEETVDVSRIQQVMRDVRTAVRTSGFGSITIRVQEGAGVPANFCALAPASI